MSTNEVQRWWCKCPRRSNQNKVILRNWSYSFRFEITWSLSTTIWYPVHVIHHLRIKFEFRMLFHHSCRISCSQYWLRQTRPQADNNSIQSAAWLIFISFRSQFLLTYLFKFQSNFELKNSINKLSGVSNQCETFQNYWTSKWFSLAYRSIQRESVAKMMEYKILGMRFRWKQLVELPFFKNLAMGSSAVENHSSSWVSLQNLLSCFTNLEIKKKIKN